MHPLDGARLKMKRARHHLKVLERNHGRFLEKYPHIIVPDFNRQDGRDVLRAKITTQPPERFKVIVSDVLHNLHTALDHIAWQLALSDRKRRGLNGEPSTYTAFPLYDKRLRWEANLRDPRRSKLLDITDPHVRDIIESFQPYHPGENELLGLLNELSRTDKHQTLLLIGSVCITSAVLPMPPGLTIADMHFEIGSFYDGDEVASWPHVEGSSRLAEDSKPKFVSQLGFAKEGPGGGQALSILGRVYHAIRHRVFPALEPFF
jgi:hypothetical protein